jgi:hypothetical protein
MNAKIYTSATRRQMHAASIMLGVTISFQAQQKKKVLEFISSYLTNLTYRVIEK